MNTLPTYLIWPNTNLTFKMNSDDSYTPYISDDDYIISKNNKYLRYSFEYLVMEHNCKTL